MKLFAPALIFCGAATFGQSPQVPHKMQFAGMTLSIRDDVRREIQKDVDALTQHPKYFNIKAERAKIYFPIIEKIFADERLPEDFKYLALQESALVPDAVSSSNAVGFWQFKDFTAREMGLRVDDSVDERMNIASSSRAAARYLKQCNHYFNNWVYALQSYQMGAGGVMRAVGDTNLGVRHMEITPETYWYVKKFLSHKIAFENAMEGKAPMEVTTLIPEGGKTLREIAQLTATEEQKLKEFNKWLKAQYIPSDRTYALLVPKGESIAGFDVLAVAPSKEALVVPAVEIPKTEKLEINGIAVIRANKGESAAAIAQRGGIGLSAFLHYNEMDIDRPLEEGQLYFLNKKKKRASETFYTVGQGENLWDISQRFGIQQKFLIKFNDLEKTTPIRTGLTLCLDKEKPGGKEIENESAIAVLDEADTFNWDLTLAQGKTGQEYSQDWQEGVGNKYTETVDLDSSGTSTPSSPAALVIHEVKPSDTLYSVARQYGVTIKELMEWNEKKDFSLSVGEKLKVRSH